MTTITLTGDNNYSGVYDSSLLGNFYVLGGANNGGHDDTDTNDGNEVFMFGNLQHKSTTVTDTSYDGTGTLLDGTQGTTFQSTATGTSDDTLHFSFTFHEGTPGATSDFLSSSFAPQGGFQSDTDTDAAYQSTADDSAWTANLAKWQASLPGSTLLVRRQ